MKCFITKTEIFNSIKLPLFYGEIFCCFNECNCELHYAKRASDDILQQLIWNNCKLVCKQRSLKIGINQEYYILKTCLTMRVISDDWNILQMLLINLIGYVITKFPFQ